jgi:hypothetical protein
MNGTWKYEPVHNAGWSTGQPYAKDAPWGNVNVIPSAAYLNHINLRSAGGPVQALFYMDTSVRPGNNSSDTMIPGIAKFVGDKNFGPFSIDCMPRVSRVECSCEFGCDCKEQCANNKVDKCPCKDIACKTKWVQID